MVSPNPSSSIVPLAQSTTLYDSVKSIIQASGPQAVAVSLPDVDARLLNNVSANLMASLDVMNSELNTTLQTVKDLGNDVNTVPATTARDVASMSAVVNVETISTIPSRVRMLLANFENAIEDPNSLYPRLVCCDIPVDPAKVLNFARKYHVLDQTLQAEGVGDDRSMPSAPKSAVDVITNVNSSLESASDFLCESVDEVAALSESFEAMRVAAENLAGISGPVNEAMNQLEEIRGCFLRMTSMLSHGDKNNSSGNNEIEHNQDALQIVKDVSSLFENLSATPFGEDLVPQVQNAKGTLFVFVKNLTALFSRAKLAISSLVATLRKFVSSLPRITQELRQFFVPTGFRALVMKPSPDLMSLLQSVDDLRTVLPEPDKIEKSASDTFGSESLATRVTSLLDKFSHLDIEQRKLFESIENQNVPGIISETVQETLETILRDLRSSLAGILDFTGDNTDEDGLDGKLKKLFAFGTEESDDKSGGKEERPPGLVENVTGAGGLFGKLFET